VNDYETEQLDIAYEEKMLGICISHTLRWIKQFSEMENKMKQAM